MSGPSYHKRMAILDQWNDLVQLATDSGRADLVRKYQPSHCAGINEITRLIDGLERELKKGKRK